VGETETEGDCVILRDCVWLPLCDGLGEIAWLWVDDEDTVRLCDDDGACEGVSEPVRLCVSEPLEEGVSVWLGDAVCDLLGDTETEGVREADAVLL